MTIHKLGEYAIEFGDNERDFLNCKWIFLSVNEFGHCAIEFSHNTTEFGKGEAEIGLGEIPFGYPLTINSYIYILFAYIQ